MKVGTIFEASHIPLRFWLQAIFLMASSKKGISSNQLHRTFGITLQDRMVHVAPHPRGDARWRLAPMGGDGGIVEIDETYFGRETATPSARADRPITKSGKAGPDSKRAIVSLVERGGSVRSLPRRERRQGDRERHRQRNVAHEARLHDRREPHLRKMPASTSPPTSPSTTGPTSTSAGRP